MFNSQPKFINDIAESFQRFGIKSESSEKGVVKDTLRIFMADTIHNSSYMAIAKPKSEKGKAQSVWEEIIEKDFIPASIDPRNKGDVPAAALIVPETDIETVEKILKSKGLEPSVYQIFPGYLVAGLKRSDVGKLIDDYKKANPEPVAEDTPLAAPIQKNEDEEQAASNAENNVDDTAETPADSGSADDIAQPNEPITDNPPPAKKMSLGPKIAAAALLGIAAGLVPLAIQTFGDKNNEGDSLPPPTAQNIQTKGAEKYFEHLKEGNPADLELLKEIAANPNLSREYLNKLADTPVGIDAVKNPSTPSGVVERAIVSDDEMRRAAAAENPKTRPEALYKLSDDPSPKVRSGLAKNPAISIDTMRKLASDQNPEVRKSLLENQELPPELLEKVANNAEPDCDFVKKMMANPCITPEILRRNSVNADECVRAGVASNPNSPKEILNSFILDKNPEIMERAFSNPNIQQEKLDALFPEGWADEAGAESVEKARVAALSNPKLKKSVMEEALVSDPQKYSQNLAKNKALPPSIANEINRIAEGRRGLRNFMEETARLKTDKKFHGDLKKESEPYNGDISIPLRKKLNAAFANSVYDPDRLASIVRNKKRDGGNNMGAGGGLLPNYDADGVNADKISSLDNSGNAPIFFNKKNNGQGQTGVGGGGNAGGSGGNGNGGGMGTDKDKTDEDVLKVADDIVSDLMANVLPPISKSIYGKSGNSDGGSDSGWRAMNNAADGIYDKTLPMDVIFKNACDNLDALQVLF